MLFLLDSNAFSDLMRKDSRVEAQLAARGPDDQVVICTTVRGEILYGIERLAAGRRRENLTAQATALFSTIPAAADAYAKIKRSREQRGLTLDENDLWIAATASALGATLVTRDSDLASVEGLRVVSWAAP